jgi:glyoxylase-like metal-dependent hydrolase (beta-lactamase superfamily II)
MRIREGLHRLGDGIVNSYLVADGSDVTIIDAGVPGYWADLPGELEAMGRTLTDVRALVLTHGHSDHIGFAERARRERAIPVSVHELDAGLARGEVPNPAKGGPTRIGPVLRFLLYGLRNGALRTKHLGAVSTYGDGATLDVPGSPRVIFTPGHTFGSVTLHFPDRDAVIAGDALVMLDPYTAREGPCIVARAATADVDRNLRTLDAVAATGAQTVLTGHGPPWTRGAEAAVERARAAGAA